MKQLLFILCCLHSILNYSQIDYKYKYATFNLNEIALLDIEPNNNSVILNLDTPSNSGESAKIVPANTTLWVNFSSAVSPSKSPRSVTITIEDGSVPPGLYLKLTTSNYTGSGRGQLGNSTREITLNKTSQSIISNIRGAYTGNGKNNGYELTYYLEIHDYKLLDFDASETLTISLTLTDF